MTGWWRLSMVSPLDVSTNCSNGCYIKRSQHIILSQIHSVPEGTFSFTVSWKFPVKNIPQQRHMFQEKVKCNL